MHFLYLTLFRKQRTFQLEVKGESSHFHAISAITVHPCTFLCLPLEPCHLLFVCLLFLRPSLTVQPWLACLTYLCLLSAVVKGLSHKAKRNLQHLCLVSPPLVLTPFLQSSPYSQVEFCRLSTGLPHFFPSSLPAICWNCRHVPPGLAYILPSQCSAGFLSCPWDPGPSSFLADSSSHPSLYHSLSPAALPSAACSTHWENVAHDGTHL